MLYNTAGLVTSPITDDGYAVLFDGMTAGRNSDSVTAGPLLFLDRCLMFVFDRAHPDSTWIGL